jgi:hypothetical protein
VRDYGGDASDECLRFRTVAVTGEQAEIRGLPKNPEKPREIQAEALPRCLHAGLGRRAGAHRHVTQGQRHVVFLSYGIPYGEHGSYELDHLVSLELGGSNVNANLWPEPHHTAQSQRADFGSFTKDRVENAAHAAGCSYRMRLRDAQRLERTDWVALGRQLGVLPQQAV